MLLPLWAQNIKSMYVSRIDGTELTLKICPYCLNARWNFQVSITRCVAHCWVCNKGITAWRFLKESGIDFDISEIRPKIIPRAEIKKLELPANIRLMQARFRLAEMARYYLMEVRGLDEKTIEEWDMRIGINADKDKDGMDWLGWTLVPLYGIEGLDSFCGVNHSWGDKKYRNPTGERDRYIPKRRWKTGSIVLVEGLFDATSVWMNSDHDVFPLFGKFLGPWATKILVAANYEHVFVCLDGDAIKEAMGLAGQLAAAGARPRLVRLPPDDDPDDVKGRINQYIAEAKPFGDTMKSRMRREMLTV